MQELTLFVNYPSIYWNTAVLSVNADNIEEFIDEDFIEKEYDEDGELIEDKKKASTVNYGKVARAIGTITKSGINVAPPLINSASKDFVPDVENNRILYSLKALAKVGDKEIEQIVKNRPFVSLDDYLERTNIKKPATVSLIKSGAFDEIEDKPREEIMKNYLTEIAEFKEKLNLQNFNSLINEGLLPEEYDFYRRLYNFNKYIRQKEFRAVKEGYLLVDERSFNFLATNYSNFLNSNYEQETEEYGFIGEKAWKKVYDKEMDTNRKWIIENQQDLLEKYNNILYNEVYEKYGKGNLSKWEMDSLSYYNGEHELLHANNFKYGISNFSTLPQEPQIEKTFQSKNGAVIPLYKLTYIIGTCIDKNNQRSSFTILTPDREIVDIKLNTEFYALYNKRISEVGEDGKKKVKEESWFSRGNKLMILGYRRGDNFVPKKYKNSIGHRISLIKDVLDSGDLVIQTERYGQGEE